jgi:hypothetical protein
MTRIATELPVRIAVFDRLSKADVVVQRLVEAGFSKEHITVVYPHSKSEQVEGVHVGEPAGAHAPKAAVEGGAIGALLGGFVALASAAATGGVSLLAIGPLVLGASGGAVAGGLVGAMLSRGFDNEIANFYDQALQRGQILVSVEELGADAHERLALAEEIFVRAGAEPMSLPEG